MRPTAVLGIWLPYSLGQGLLRPFFNDYLFIVDFSVVSGMIRSVQRP